MSMKDPKLVISIYLRGNELKPGYVSEVLGVRHSQSQRKGELRTDSKKLIAKIGVWSLVAKTASKAVPDHIDELLATIGNFQARLNQIDGVEDAYLDILIALDDQDTRTVEFRLAERHLHELSRLGLYVQFTVM